MQETILAPKQYTPSFKRFLMIEKDLELLDLNCCFSKMSIEKEISCIGGNVCHSFCSEPFCQNPAAICNDKKCKCRQGHDSFKNKTNRKCRSKIPLLQVIKSLEFHENSYQNSMPIIESAFEDLTNWLSKQKDQILALMVRQSRVQQSIRYYESMYGRNINQFSGFQIQQILEEKSLDSKQSVESFSAKIKPLIQLRISQEIVKPFQKNIQGFKQSIKNAKFFKAIDSSILKTKREIEKFTNMFQESYQNPFQFKLLYRASQNDFKAQMFHQKCDNIKNTVTLIHTKSDKIIGGYTPLEWKASIISGQKQPNRSQQFQEKGVNRPSKGSFLFSLTEDLQFHIKSQEDSAEKVFREISYDKSYGPIFGWNDLEIVDESHKHKSTANIGQTYTNSLCQENSLKAKEMFTGYANDDRFETMEWQVFQLLQQPNGDCKSLLI